MTKRIKVNLVIFFIILCTFTFGTTIIQAKTQLLNKTSVSIQVGKTYPLKVSPSNQKVIWSTNDKKVATVKNGVITAKATGKATITAKVGNTYGTCKVTVYQPASKVKLKESSKCIEVGDTFTINSTFTPSNATYQELTWSVESSCYWSIKGNYHWYDEKVKHISGNSFKALEEGTTTITAYQKETNKEYSIKVTIIEALGSFSLTCDEMKVDSITTYPGHHTEVLGVFDNEGLYWSRDDEKRMTFQYKMKDKSIATVNSDGQITGIKEGTTTLILTASNGKSEEYSVTVAAAKPAGITKDKLRLKDVKLSFGAGGYKYDQYSTDHNMVKVDDTVLIPLSEESYAIFQYNEKAQNLTYYQYNQEHKLIESKPLNMPYPIWGGVFLGTDGYYYMAFGQGNKEENNAKIVYSIVKYDKSFKEIARTNITGGQSFTIEPFYASTCSMVMNGTTLVVYTSRLRYTSNDGLNHQSNIGFIIDTTTMTATYVGAEFPYNHVSHSLNQFVRFDGNNLIYVDHGDGYPRSVVMQIHNNFMYQTPIDTGRNVTRTIENDLINIKGPIGYNHTGTRVGGFEIGTYINIVAGVSIPHDTLTGNFMNYKVKNVYVVLASKDGTNSTLKWLTNYQEGGTSTALNLRMLKINDDKFALIYQVDTVKGESTQSKIVFTIINSNGEILQQKEWVGKFSADVAPILIGDKIIWVNSQPVSYDKYQNYVNTISFNE